MKSLKGKNDVKSSPDVSVIIPTYNGEKVIERAIRSVLNQIGDWNIEILVCDDCSTDNTINIAQKLGAKVFINSKNTGGPNHGRNVGIKNATGYCIAFLDQDDEWLPDKLQRQMKEIKDGAEFVFSASIRKLG